MIPIKYKYKNISAAGASMLLAGLAANPSTAFLTQGPLGRVVFNILDFLAMIAANYGVIFLNVGASNISTFIDEGNFDGSWESAQAAIKKIRDQNRKMTDEEIKKIDEPVIAAFRKFAGFGRKH